MMWAMTHTARARKVPRGSLKADPARRGGELPSSDGTVLGGLRANASLVVSCDTDTGTGTGTRQEDGGRRRSAPGRPRWPTSLGEQRLFSQEARAGPATRFPWA